MIKHKFILLSVFILSVARPSAHARVIEERWHVFSRSCAIGAGAQESITYALMLSRWVYVRSEHYKAGDDGRMRWLHNVETPTDGPKGPGWHFGWRGRAGDFGEFWSGHVTGQHWGLKRYTGQKYLMWMSDATDCNLTEW